MLDFTNWTSYAIVTKCFWVINYRYSLLWRPLITTFSIALSEMSRSQGYIPLLFSLLLSPAFPSFYDCYDTKCWGAGAARNISVPCDNSYNYCSLNRLGLPLCMADDSFHQGLGHGVHCFGHYKCGTDIRGGAICQDQDYSELAVFIVLACLVIFLMLLIFCCWAKRLSEPGNRSNCCWRRRPGSHVRFTEYTELLVREQDSDPPRIRKGQVVYTNYTFVWKCALMLATFCKNICTGELSLHALETLQKLQAPCLFLENLKGNGFYAGVVPKVALCYLQRYRSQGGQI